MDLLLEHVFYVYKDEYFQKFCFFMFSLFCIPILFCMHASLWQGRSALSNCFTLEEINNLIQKQPSCKKSVWPQQDHWENRCEIQGGSQEIAWW